MYWERLESFNSLFNICSILLKHLRKQLAASSSYHEVMINHQLPILIKHQQFPWFWLILLKVEIITHMGPHRRLWMGPQFCFKTYQNVQNTTVLSSQSSALLSQSPEINLSNMDVTADEVDLESLKWVSRLIQASLKKFVSSHKSLKWVLRNLKWVSRKSQLSLRNFSSESQEILEFSKEVKKCGEEKLLHVKPVQILLSQNILNSPIKNVFHIKMM